MKRSRNGGQGANPPQQEDFLQLAVKQMNPEFLGELTRRSPEMVFEMLKVMDPEVLAGVVNSNPAAFSGMFGSMPRALMRRLLTEAPDVIFGMLRRIDPEILMDMMGLE